MNLTEACLALEVSRSGYHAHLRKHHRPRQRQDQQLALEIRAAFAASRGTYGSPRLVHALRAKGIHPGKNRVARLMREQQLRVRQKRRFVPRTTVADKTAAVAPNHLLQRSAPKRLNEVWVTDITYLPTREGWLYLAAEMDLCSRRILGWSTREDLASELPKAALERALQTRGSKTQQPAPPQRPWLPVYQHGLPQKPQIARHHRQHEPHRQLLRQRHHGILLGHAENRMLWRCHPGHTSPGTLHGLRLHRNLL